MTTHEKPTCRRLTSTKPYQGKQGFDYAGAISAQSVGASGICMHLLNMPPGARANTHLHENHETAIYVVSGRSGMWYGERLEKHMEMGPGDFVYIPAGIPHLPYNLSDSEACSAVIARTDPNEQESVVLLPELDEMKAKQEAA